MNMRKNQNSILDSMVKFAPEPDLVLIYLELYEKNGKKKTFENFWNEIMLLKY